MRCVPLLLASTLASACDLASEPLSERRFVGIIEWQSSSLGEAITSAGHTGDAHVVIAAPDTVAAGAPVDVTIATIGMSGCWQQDGAEISYADRLAVVTPYDLVMTTIGGALTECTGALIDLPRTMRLVFGQTGVATLRVSGRRVTGGELSDATPATVEKQIVVR